MSATDPVHRPVDIDRLADYVEGLLTPTDAAMVRDLVEADPAWAATLAALRSAYPAVTATLSSYAADTGPMPSDVAERLTHSLRSQPPASNVASLAEARNRPAGRRRGRAARIATNGWVRAAAVLIVVFVGIGFATQLHTGSTKSSSTATSDRAAPQLSLPNMPSRPGLTVTASGIDYSALPSATPANGAPAPALTPGHAPGLNGPTASSSEFEPAPGVVDPALDRLLDPAALGNCLTAVERSTGGVTSEVDFATYQGRPAVIVTLASIDTVVASGPGCGLAGSGADEIATTPVR
jgi:hypothetical protein